MTKIMVDLETVGTRAGCAILSIGAVRFDEFTCEVGDSFYEIIRLSSCENSGLFKDPSTMEWWSSQSPEAREVLLAAQSNSDGDNCSLFEALRNFNDYLRRINIALGPVELYGNGSDFDNAILISAYAAAGIKPNFGSHSNRCYRTLKELVPHIKISRSGVHHNALDDARSQAYHAIKILDFLGKACANQVLNEKLAD